MKLQLEENENKRKYIMKWLYKVLAVLFPYGLIFWVIPILMLRLLDYPLGILNVIVMIHINVVLALLLLASVSAIIWACFWLWNKGFGG